MKKPKRYLHRFLIFLTTLFSISFSFAEETINISGDFIEITDEKLKKCFTFEGVTIEKQISWKLKMNLYLVDIPKMMGSEAGAIATSKKYHASGMFLKKIDLKPIGGVPYKDAKGFTKMLKVFVDCK